MRTRAADDGRAVRTARTSGRSSGDGGNRAKGPVPIYGKTAVSDSTSVSDGTDFDAYTTENKSDSTSVSDLFSVV